MTLLVALALYLGLGFQPDQPDAGGFPNVKPPEPKAYVIEDDSVVGNLPFPGWPW